MNKSPGKVGRTWLIAVPVSIVFLVMLLAARFLEIWPTRRPSFHDSFAEGRLSEWKSFGGNWQIYNAGARNDSDERGAKLVTGTRTWENYSLDADVLLLGQSGDAGVVVRSSDEEDGVDSYDGYYVGLRDHNNTVAIGRADHGWMEYQVAQLPGGIHPLQWYHLRVVAVGCEIAAKAYNPASNQSISVAMADSHCALTGGIGLRSYSSGGIWKQVRVAPAGIADLRSIEGNISVEHSAQSLQTEAGFNSMLLNSYRSGSGPSNISATDQMMHTHTPSLGSLRLVSSVNPPTVSVHGSVVLTSPLLIVQDSTGGVAIQGTSSAGLKIGDEIEISGRVIPQRFSASFEKPQTRLLWSGEPAPPISISSSQAAAGKFDDMFVEVEGYLEGAEFATEKIILNLETGHQHYRAILTGAPHNNLLEGLRPKSLLRLRGVCVVDPAFTENLTPFVILLRSSNDVTLLAGPPWWDVKYLIDAAWIMTALVLMGTILYLKAEQWRVRAVTEERARMARDIHDTLAQGFAGISLQLESALRGSPEEPIDSEHIKMALQMARQSRKEAHVTVAALRLLHSAPSLAAILEKVLKPQSLENELRVTISCFEAVARLPIETEIQILRITQEAVANAVQHSRASEVNVIISSDGRSISIAIRDNGCGFQPENAPSVEDGHFGITGMMERARNIDSTLTVESSYLGTTVFLSVPYPPSQHGLQFNFWYFARRSFWSLVRKPQLKEGQ